jgi:hypothetical protein
METGKQGCSVDYTSLLLTSPKPGQMTLYETDEIPAMPKTGEGKSFWTYYDVASLLEYFPW